MTRYIMLLLVLFSGFATAASYQGDDIYEVGRAYAGNHSVGHFYGGKLDGVTEQNPVCFGRNPMRFTEANQKSQPGCWWIVDERLFGYTPSRKVFEFNIYLLELNDNYFNINYM